MLSGRRGLVLAGVVAIVVTILLLLFLVLPKVAQVSDAKKKLEDARSNQTTLESQLSALQDAQAAAPQSQQTIDRVNRLVPPTADLPGLILLLQNAATGSGIDLNTMTPSTPVFDQTTGLSTITVSITATGTYFTLTEYLYKIETLQSRAAKVLNVNLSASAASGSSSSSSPQLSMTATLSTFTADISAGPGSSPGPQTAGATGATGPTS